MQRLSIAPICPKTISPATRQKNGCLLRDQSFYSDNEIDLRLNTNVAAIDVRAHEVELAERRRRSVRPPAARDRRRAGSPSLPGAKPSDVLTLRSLKDSRAIIERAKTARRVGRARRQLHRP